jgi:thiol-disulfide isomerase/thioredoxin
LLGSIITLKLIVTMNKLTLSAAVSAGLLLLASCSSSPKFSLKGENLPEELNGKYVYVTPEGSKEASEGDSVLVENGAFTYTTTDLNTTTMAYVAAPEARIQVPVIKEAGDFRLEADANGRYTIVSNDPASLNATYKAMMDELDTTLTPLNEQYRAKYQELSAEDLSDEEMEKLQEEANAIEEQYNTSMDQIARKYYESNSDNAVGVIAFQMIPFEEDTDFVAAYEDASQTVKDNKNLQKRYNTLKVAMETAEGMAYKGDYTIEDGEGNTMKLSDYMEEGKYLLVDFWASWSGPCRRAMPHLAGIAKDHSKTINVLSVGVWEESKADNDMAREDLEMTWNTFFDKDSKSVDEYGIYGIPTLLLVNPKGTIVYRGYDPEAVEATIKELGL